MQLWGTPVMGHADLDHSFANTQTPAPAALSDPAQLDGSAVAMQLGVDPRQGLTADDVEYRLRQDGPNELVSHPPAPAWQRFLAQFRDPLVYLLLVAVLVTFSIWVLEAFVGWPVDALVILVIVILNAVLGFAQEHRSQRAAEALTRLTATSCSVLRAGASQRVPVSALVRGDILLLSEGDSIGADARLLQANALKVQEASLTGESEAVLKCASALRAPTSLAERCNMVFKGTAVIQGTGIAVVTATGMKTEIGAIANLLETTQDEATPLQKEVRQIGRMLGQAVITIAVVVVISVLFLSDIQTATDVIDVLLLGVSLAVAAVPEGLPAILSLVLAIGVQRMAVHQAIIRKLSSVETLGSATIICSDKTGTLTRSEMTIERITTASGCVTVSGTGYNPQGEFNHDGSALQDGPLRSELIVLLSGGSLAGNANLAHDHDGQWCVHGDPTEAAFLVAERKLAIHERRQHRFERIAEIPFTSDRKMMSVIAVDHEHNDQRVVISKGAPDVLLNQCSHLRVGMETLPLDDEKRAAILADVDDMSDAALRTLSVAYRTLAADENMMTGPALEQNLVFVGTVGIIDPPRAEAATAIATAHRAGIRVIMITGDHPRTAARIATDLGIIRSGEIAITGAELDAMDDAQLTGTVRNTSVFARVAPAHKLRIVDALQAEGQIVAMTGDGVNDAPALKAADIGIAMGINGTEVTRESAKMILADDNFATIVTAVREGRAILDNMRKFLRYLLSSNMGEVLTVFLAIVGASLIGLTAPDGAVILPLLATQILWINLMTDAAPALAMGIDTQSHDVMQRAPRKMHDRIIDGQMWSTVLQVGLIMSLTTLLTMDWLLPGGLLPGHHDIDTARTAAFTVLVFSQLFNAFNARSETASAFNNLFSNRWLWAAVVIAVALQIAVVEMPLMNAAFSTVHLSMEHWVLCIIMASTTLWFCEILKMVRRWRIRNKN